MTSQSPSRDTTGFLSGERHLSFPDFQERVKRAAAGLAALGVGAGDTIALLLRNDFAFLEATFAARYLGAYAVPLNWHFKGEEVAYVVADCGARLLIGHRDLLAGVLDDLPKGLRVLSVPTPPEIAGAYRVTPEAGALPGTEDWDAWISAASPIDRPAVAAGESIIYTSGTTGHPKGVRRAPPTPDQAVLVEQMRRQVFGIAPGMRAAITGPLYHSAPNAFAVRAAAMNGLFLIMPRFDAEALLRHIEEYGVTHLFMVPTMFVRLLRLPQEVRRRYDVSSLQAVCHAGSPCPPEIKRAMIEWWGPVINEYYGGTETGPGVFCTSAEWLRYPGTVGRPLADSTARIYDDAGRVLGPNQIGEVYTRIHYYPDFTYLNAPEKRQAVERDGLITCGDVGYYNEEGFFFLCDRKLDMVISGGVNIYPAEIENVLLSLAGVRDCAVIGVPDPEFGEALLALVEPQEGVTLTPEGLRTALKPHLADYKVPRRIEIRQSLPREDTGKIVKRKLKEPYWQGSGRTI